MHLRYHALSLNKFRTEIVAADFERTSLLFLPHNICLPLLFSLVLGAAERILLFLVTEAIIISTCGIRKGWK
jgi:hypothetical protein